MLSEVTSVQRESQWSLVASSLAIAVLQRKANIRSQLHEPSSRCKLEQVKPINRQEQPSELCLPFGCVDSPLVLTPIFKQPEYSLVILRTQKTTCQTLSKFQRRENRTALHHPVAAKLLP